VPGTSIPAVAGVSPGPQHSGALRLFSSTDGWDVTNPFFEPVASVWRRIAGFALLVAGAALTVVLSHSILDFLDDAGRRQAFTSSSMIFGLVLFALCGICWQAGYRLAFQRPDRSGTLFSRPAWFAIGTALVVFTSLMAAVIVRARTPTVLDLQVLLFLGGIGAWCLVLALRRGHGTR
jgi:drug/metabolite transporter (DMT)-like permease